MYFLYLHCTKCAHFLMKHHLYPLFHYFTCIPAKNRLTYSSIRYEVGSNGRCTHNPLVSCRGKRSTGRLMHRWEDNIKLITDKSRRTHGLIQEKECWHHRWNSEIYGLHKDLSIVDDFLCSLKYIDLDKKHYFNLQAFIYKDILSLDRQYAENNPGIKMISCNCVRVAV